MTTNLPFLLLNRNNTVFPGPLKWPSTVKTTCFCRIHETDNGTRSISFRSRVCSPLNSTVIHSLKGEILWSCSHRYLHRKWRLKCNQYCLTCNKLKKRVNLLISLSLRTQIPMERSGKQVFLYLRRNVAFCIYQNSLPLRLFVQMIEDTEAPSSYRMIYIYMLALATSLIPFWVSYSSSRSCGVSSLSFHGLSIWKQVLEKEHLKQWITEWMYNTFPSKMSRYDSIIFGSRLSKMAHFIPLIHILK
jgi:hypothetical protein